MVKDYKEAFDLIESYDELVKRSLDIISDIPYKEYVENDESAQLDLVGDEAVVTWWHNESDYYGGGYLSEKHARFPANLLFSPDYEEFLQERDKNHKEEKAQAARVRKAQAAVERQRKEEAERAEYIRLSAKYGKPVV